MNFVGIFSPGFDLLVEIGKLVTGLIILGASAIASVAQDHGMSLGGFVIVLFTIIRNLRENSKTVNRSLKLTVTVVSG